VVAGRLSDDERTQLAGLLAKLNDER
jgi:hypothetical protein